VWTFWFNRQQVSFSCPSYFHPAGAASSLETSARMHDLLTNLFFILISGVLLFFFIQQGFNAFFYARLVQPDLEHGRVPVVFQAAAWLFTACFALALYFRHSHAGLIFGYLSVAELALVSSIMIKRYPERAFLWQLLFLVLAAGVLLVASINAL
jgi:hypothetical protein